MNPEVKKLFFKGSLLLLLVVILDRGIGSVVEYFFLREQQGDTSVTTYAVTGVSQDLMIFGSSRASHHYVASLITKETGYSSINVGRDGMDMPYYVALLQGVLEHHKPKIIILDLNLDDLSFDNPKETTILSLLPYINKSDAISESIREEYPFHFWKGKLSKLYRFNSMPASILQHSLGIGQKHEKGYEPLFGNKIKSITDSVDFNSDYKENPKLVASFDQFISIAEKNQIELYVIISPTAHKRKYSARKTANRILSKYGFKLYDYSDIGRNDVSLFYDNSHLNNSGAEKFTRRIIHEVLKSSNNSPSNITSTH